jgi:WD40 repeat protein
MSSPGTQLWVSRYNGQANNDDVATALALSPDGSMVFVTGSSVGPVNGDYATVAYRTSTGTKVWAKRYSGPFQGDAYVGGDTAAAITVSPDGSRVFVTGTSANQRGTDDYATVAYDAATGAKLWAERFDAGEGNSRDVATAMALSPGGSVVFVTGYGSVYAAEFGTVAYDAATGARLWARIDDSFGGDYVDVAAIGVSPDGSSVFVTGRSQDPVTNNDYATVAYDAVTGATQWAKGYDSGTNGDDFATALAVSPDGSTVFVTGYSSRPTTIYDYATVAYEASTGGVEWVKRYDGHGNASSELASALKVSPDGSRVFVTGFSKNSSSHGDAAYDTVAYGAATGAKLWVSRYDGPGKSDDLATAMDLSPDGSTVFVTGGSPATSTGLDYATLAYDAATGAQLWLRRYNDPGNGDDLATSVKVSPDGSRVFVTGGSQTAPATWDDYATVAYAAA